MTREEHKAYLRGKLQGMERIADFASGDISVPWKKIIDNHIEYTRKALAALDIPQLVEHYGTDRVEIPSPWEWDETFSTPKYGSPVFGSDHKVYTDLDDEDEPRLGLRKRKPKRVWFKAEEKPRNPQIGDWILYHGGWHQVIAETPYAYVCAVRHEDFDDAPQIVTQADIDRVLGGSK